MLTAVSAILPSIQVKCGRMGYNFSVSKKIVEERFGSIDKFMSMVQPEEKDEIVPPGNTTGLLSRNV